MHSSVIHIATNRFVVGRAINDAIRDAEQLAAGMMTKAAGIVSYGYTSRGYPHVDAGDAAIIVTVRIEQ